MKLTRSPWKVRALSVEEMLVLTTLHYLAPVLNELRAADPEVFARMVAQRSLTSLVAKHSGLDRSEVLAVLVALEHKGLVEREGFPMAEAVNV